MDRKNPSARIKAILDIKDKEIAEAKARLKARKKKRERARTAASQGNQGFACFFYFIFSVTFFCVSLFIYFFIRIFALISPDVGGPIEMTPPLTAP
jgi:hypothetical protein